MVAFTSLKNRTSDWKGSEFCAMYGFSHAVFSLLTLLRTTGAVSVFENSSSSQFRSSSNSSAVLDDSTAGIDPTSFITDVENTASIDLPNLPKRARSESGMHTLHFTKGDRYVNFNISQCALRWGQVIGRWDFFNGTTRTNASYTDIYRDTCRQAGLSPGNGEQLRNPKYQATMSTALAANLRSSRTEATGALNALIPTMNFTSCISEKQMTIEAEKMELRKLLQEGLQWSLIHKLTLTIAISSVPGAGVRTGTWVASYGNLTNYDIFLIEHVGDQILNAVAGIGLMMAAYILENQLNLGIHNAMRDGVDQLVAAGGVAFARRELAVLAMLNGMVNAVTTQDPNQIEEELDRMSPSLQGSYDMDAMRIVDCGVEDSLAFAAAGLSQSNASVLGISPLATLQDSIQAEQKDGICPALD